MTPFPLFLTRHGQSEAMLEGLLGGDSPLTAQGQAYALSLARIIQEQLASEVSVVPGWVGGVKHARSRALHTTHTMALAGAQIAILYNSLYNCIVLCLPAVHTGGLRQVPPQPQCACSADLHPAAHNPDSSTPAVPAAASASPE